MQKSSCDYESLKEKQVQQIRHSIRCGAYTGHTAGLGAGFLQANLAILPVEHALDFMRYCQRNAKPCPIVGVSETGDPMLSTLGSDIDVRTDVPAYNIYRDGVLDSSVNDISDLWREDFVTFAIGCSFTFEHALGRAGFKLWHVLENKVVPMYRTNIATRDAGPFGGDLVVTMRAFHPDKVDEARSISRRYPLAHGGPVFAGDPQEIGIADLGTPDWGDAPPDIENTIPVFWACGVTPQNAILRAKLPLTITHKPGHMLLTDVDEQAEIPVI
ncbi:hypothetical protein AB833_10935 [Chromatiales bacterium (ex Bugula neritina AB1)]|nr:hypothetical protein AB833_10935 [Chromatiales bacterium (ex Bugula neritina AB1)]